MRRTVKMIIYKYFTTLPVSILCKIVTMFIKQQTLIHKENARHQKVSAEMEN